MGDEKIAGTKHTEGFASQKARPSNVSADLIELEDGEPPQGSYVVEGEMETP